MCSSGGSLPKWPATLARSWPAARSFIGVSYLGAEAQALGRLPLGNYQVARLEAEQTGNDKHTSLWNAGTTGDGLTCATVPALKF